MSELFVAFIGIVAGFVGGVGKAWLDRRARIDDGLLAKRTELYLTLWRLTGIFPLYPRDRTLRHEQVAKRMVELRTWYFEEGGGLYMVGKTQAAYLFFQSVLDKLSADETRHDDLVSDHDYTVGQEASTALRTCLTQDLYSRGGSSLI
ncbi:hypothetical protein [Sandaracinobacteroides saxicola]|uniref:Uncharacterized protein n=1 Tax=Sandaracinobacteroides saxicola TaxID=2759707 RepID=A0A7G5IF12_9SPHN|nr:hypothetical protein [Sandaracinobacteroides saxicola]QMW21954.1 hypothetical protein H3309_11245 [Sandaracinobacteroides saxicola]